MADAVWDKAIRFLTDNALSIIILFLVALLVSAVISTIIGALVIVIPGVAVFAIFGTVAGLILAWYVSMMHSGLAMMKSAKNVNYVEAVRMGVKNVLDNLVPALEMGLVLLLGSLANFLISTSVQGALLGLVLNGIATSVALVIAFAILVERVSISSFFNKLKALNAKSGNAGLLLYITLFMPIVPYIGYLYFLFVPISLVILVNA